jgi:cytochrome c553
MTYTSKLRMSAFICAFLAMTVARPVHARPAAPEIVTRNCSGCHGVDGNADLPYFPRLAGLNAAYLEKKMTEFKDVPSPAVDQVFHWIASLPGRGKSSSAVTPAERSNMIGVAHAVKPEELKEAAEWYAKQTPAPRHTRHDQLTQRGKDIFEKGVPDQQVLACAGCHGQNAEGQASAPRLAGQNAEYVQAQMDKFRRGDLKHAPEMTMVAKEVSADQARAVAAYLQSKSELRLAARK